MKPKVDYYSIADLCLLAADKSLSNITDMYVSILLMYVLYRCGRIKYPGHADNKLISSALGLGSEPAVA